MPDALPPAVVQFLSDYIHSIVQLELLLQLHAQSDRTWTVAEAARQLYTAPSMTQPLLDSLVAAGFVKATANPETTYQFAPQSAQQGELIETLGRLYRERRVTVINAIYAHPTQALQNFADAFRIRKKEQED